MGRVVITGMGILLPDRISAEEFYQMVEKKQQSITGQSKRFQDFDVDTYCGKHNVRRNDFFTKTGLAAMIQASEMAGLTKGQYVEERTGAIVSTAYGPMETIENYLTPVIMEGTEHASPSLFSNTVINAALGKYSMDFKLKGVSSMGCGINAVVKAYESLKNGKADCMFAGGVDCLTDVVIESLGLGSGVKEEEELKISEGAGFLVMETLEHAKQRQATIWAEVTGYGCASDFHLHSDIRNVQADTIAYTMNEAVKMSGIDVASIKAVESLGLTTQAKDAEKEAVSTVCKGPVQMVYEKELFGEAFSCSEILEVIHACYWLRENGTKGDSVCINSMHVGGNVYSMLVNRYKE